METAATCEIARLPEDLLSAAISRTTPRDACRAAAVSPAFRAAADSDAVWSTFLPCDLPPLADGEISPAPPSKKGLFLRLSDRPLLLTDRLMAHEQLLQGLPPILYRNTILGQDTIIISSFSMIVISSMWTDRETGAKCYVLSARALQIVWGDTPHYWRWIPLTDSRFSEGAELMSFRWLEIRGKIHSKMLSQNLTYAAYMVFKIADESYGLDSPLQEASVSVGGSKSTRQVCLQGYESEDEDSTDEVSENYWPMETLLRRSARRRNRRLVRENVPLPQKRADGWLELEMGEFCSEEGEDGEVCISLTETKGGNWKQGLIVQGIEIRPKKSG